MPNELKSRTLINEEVALHLEWKRYDDLTLSQEWLDPKAKRWKERPPDYCGEWEHAGPLYEKLHVSGWRIWQYWPGVEADCCGNFYFRQIGVFGNGYFNSSTKILTEAITRAFHAAFVEGKECKNMD